MTQCLTEKQEISYILEDWFIDGFFDEKVSVSVTHLHKLGIVDDDFIYCSMIRVLNTFFERLDSWQHEANKDFESKLVELLYVLWVDQMGDEQTFVYTFAQGRWLITWDYQRLCWKTTSLGRMFQELSPVQAAILLLSIDTLFSTDEFDFRHISSDVLSNVLHSQTDNIEVSKVMAPHQEILKHLGILRNPKRSEDEVKRPILILTPLGKTVLSQVLDKDNPLRDIASVIIETEKLGVSFKDSALEINEIVLCHIKVSRRTIYGKKPVRTRYG